MSGIRSSQQEDGEELENIVLLLHIAYHCLPFVLQLLQLLRGGVKKKILVFFDFRSKGGGGLGQSKKSLSENTQIFLTKGVEGLTQSKRVLSEKLRFFGIIYQKRGVL